MAGPDPQEGHPPGVVWIAAVGPRGGCAGTVAIALQYEFGGDRLQIRDQTVAAALSMLLTLLDPADREQTGRVTR